jgi:CheY-like chemotaxis protein
MAETSAVDNRLVVLPNPTPLPGTIPAVRAKAAALPAAILAITDDPEVRDLLMEMALADGFGVRCATSELEAANIIHAERPGIVLVDLDMRDRVGTKFLRALRASPFRGIRCLAITASNDSMLSISVDAAVLFKPGLEGLDAEIQRLVQGAT